MDPALRTSLVKIGKGALIAGLGAAGAVALAQLQSLDFGAWQPIVGMVLSVAVNAFNQWRNRRLEDDAASAE